MSPSNHLVNVLSHWLARHADNDELRAELAAADTSSLSPDQREAVEELLQELSDGNGRGDLEMVVRETLEALVLGS
jgi:ABC-type uncharacterized transport system involved in gliding motility auxiliary subunit